MKKTVILFIIFFYASVLFASDGPEIGTIGDINRSSGEIVVNLIAGKTKVEMDEKLYVRIGDNPVIIKAAFPMLTVVKCRISGADKKNLNNLKKGMTVYKYQPGIEKKKDEIVSDKSSVEKDNNNSGAAAEGRIEDFVSFLGFSSSNTIDDAIKKLGTPSSISVTTQYTFDTAYWDSGTQHLVSMFYNRNTRRIDGIRMYSFPREKPFGKAAREFLKKKKVDDKKMNLLGMHKDAVSKLYGPTDRHFGIEGYYRDLGYAKFTVNILCYDFNQKLCSEVSVQWLSH